MTQKDQVKNAMKENGGYATLSQLYHVVDTSTWGTKTPDATIRKIVQESDFFKIKPGLWALKECKEEVLNKLSIVPSEKQSDNAFTHSYYQGIVVQLGNNKQNIKTYIPAQDKNKKFLETELSKIASFTTIPKFTSESLLSKAKTVDVIWFNERSMPCGFYEIEHSTNITNSLDKFYELQDFRADFRIIADIKRKNEFLDKISKSIYNPIRDMVKFISYEDITKQYEKENIILDDYL